MGMDTSLGAQAARRTHPLLRLLGFVPLLAALVALASGRGTLRAWEWALLLALGVLAWTLIEYLLHRFAFHWVPRSPRLRRLNRHLDHHAHPEDPANCVASLSFSLPVTSLVWLLLSGTFGWQLGAALTAGAMLGYLFYELVHFATHFSALERGPFGFWRRYHFEHHRRATRCFGFTTPLWDVLLRTGPKARLAALGREAR